MRQSPNVVMALTAIVLSCAVASVGCRSRYEALYGRPDSPDYDASLAVPPVALQPSSRWPLVFGCALGATLIVAASMYMGFYAKLSLPEHPVPVPMQVPVVVPEPAAIVSALEARSEVALVADVAEQRVSQRRSLELSQVSQFASMVEELDAQYVVAVRSGDGPRIDALLKMKIDACAVVVKLGEIQQTAEIAEKTRETAVVLHGERIETKKVLARMQSDATLKIAGALQADIQRKDRKDFVVWRNRVTGLGVLVAGLAAVYWLTATTNPVDVIFARLQFWLDFVLQTLKTASTARSSSGGLWKLAFGWLDSRLEYLGGIVTLVFSGYLLWKVVPVEYTPVFMLAALVVPTWQTLVVFVACVAPVCALNWAACEFLVWPRWHDGIRYKTGCAALVVLEGLVSARAFIELQARN